MKRNIKASELSTILMEGLEAISSNKGNHNNSTTDRRRLERGLRIVKALNEDFNLGEVELELLKGTEGCWGDDKKGMFIPNQGTMVEQIVKHHLGHYATVSKSTRAGYDFSYKGVKYEIKYSSTQRHLCTKVTLGKDKKWDKVLLINACGVWVLDEAEVLANLRPKKNVLDSNRPMGHAWNDKDVDLVARLGY